MPLSRRSLLTSGAATGAGLVVAGALRPASALAAPDSSREHDRGEGSRRRLFPPLAHAEGDLLALPRGFSATAVAISGSTEVHDGTGKAVGTTPERPDGTLAVAGPRGYRLIQNHEASPGSSAPVPFVDGTVYDRGALGGGCTVIETTRRGARVSEWVGLSGTISNCAGGPTPWGSWLTCEESESKAGTGTLEKDHGYVFEVFAGQPRDQVPRPIAAWGRAPHEAVVVEPSRRRVYLTEDASKPTGLVYRWTAPSGYTLRAGIADHLRPNDGTLEALAVVAPDGGVLPDLAYVTAAQIGRPFATRWVRVPDRHAKDTSLRKQFADGTVTHSKKLEGAWGDTKGMYFVASFAFAAGDLPADATPHDGQLWYYEYASSTLTLVAYYPYNPLLHSETIDPETGLGRSLDLAFDGPDGCHVSPYGSLVLTEDGNTANHLLSWSRSTGTQAIARNLIVQERTAAGVAVYSEMTGPCFSPDGQVLFGNVQEPGHVFAITGPWRTYLG
ncbi:alkaline phosphatase PhoX [Pedococcus sp. KACC 23699]|uniref:Alkaline phosphatase PhoX n=1 Tax=Pedococcus sp. KACC 23699 TaxID=3149228 RepID=A0AAU7JWS1_9MICO